MHVHRLKLDIFVENYSATYLNQIVSKLDTCLNQTLFEVHSYLFYSTLNLGKLNMSLNQANYAVQNVLVKTGFTVFYSSVAALA